ncbi:uncharacterized, partial [Tachysurus ichikawai]
MVQTMDELVALSWADTLIGPCVRCSFLHDMIPVALNGMFTVESFLQLLPLALRSGAQFLPFATSSSISTPDHLDVLAGSRRFCQIASDPEGVSSRFGSFKMMQQIDP